MAAGRQRGKPRLLFVQELGGGFGHLHRLLAVARHFPDAQISFAAPHEALAAYAVGESLGPTVSLVSSVAWDMAAAEAAVRRTPPHTLADTLHCFGFADPARLAQAADVFRRMVTRFDPDLIVGDFAPTLRLAADGTRPIVVIGNGFTIPPALAPLPAMRPGASAPPESLAREAAVLQAVNALRGSRGEPAFAQVADLFRGDRTFVCCFAGFDPYRALRREPTIAQQLNLPVIPVGPAYPARRGPAIFCYLDPEHPSLNTLLTALNGIPDRTLLFLRNRDPREITPHCAPQIGVLQNPAPFEQILPETRLMIHHGNLGTATAGLLAGTVQLMLPLHLEQELNVRAMEHLGTSVGLEITATGASDPLRDLIGTLLANHGAQAKAIAVGRHLQVSLVDQPESAIVAACRELLAG